MTAAIVPTISSISGSRRGEERASESVGATAPHISIAALACFTVVLYSLENVMAPHLTAIARDLGMSDAERDAKLGGQMNSAFYLVGAGLSVVNGVLADGCNRTALLGATLLVGSLTALSATFISSYAQLVALRCGMGVVLAGFQPVAFSLLGDVASPARRAGATTLVGSCVGLGVLFGQVASGALGARFGWRAVCTALGAPIGIAGVLCLGERPARAALTYATAMTCGHACAAQ